MTCLYVSFGYIISHHTSCTKKGLNGKSPHTVFICVGPCRDSSWLCIGTFAGLYVVDLATSELVKILHFKGKLCVIIQEMLEYRSQNRFCCLAMLFYFYYLLCLVFGLQHLMT